MNNKNETFFASCPSGLESLLESEVKKINPTFINVRHGGVLFKAEVSSVMDLILDSRMASRVFKELNHVDISTEKDIYSSAKSIPWDRYLRVDSTLKINTILDQNSKVKFKNSIYLSQLVKDGIVDFFRDKFNARPSVELKNPDALFLLRIDSGKKTKASIFVDLCGEPLSNRGYRVPGHEAPLRENLAAAIIKLTEWDFDREIFIDPMCGSGTFLIEATLMKLNLPPSYLHIINAVERDSYERFSVCKAPWFIDDGHLAAFQSKLRKIFIRIIDILNEEADLDIYGADIDSRSINLSRENLTRAKLLDVFLRPEDCLNFLPPKGKIGVVVCNPPYGERLNKGDDLETLYHNLGEHLKNNFKGFRAYIFSGNLPLRKSISLQTSRRIPLFNGKIECRLFEYKLF